MQKITPFLWFDGKAEEAMNSISFCRSRDHLGHHGSIES